MGWAACLGESMLQLPRVRWRLLACLNGASPDCIIIIVVVVVVVSECAFKRVYVHNANVGNDSH